MSFSLGSLISKAKIFVREVMEVTESMISRDLRDIFASAPGRGAGAVSWQLPTTMGSRGYPQLPTRVGPPHSSKPWEVGVPCSSQPARAVGGPTAPSHRYGQQ